ncbi:MAG: hypothetical protein HQL63_12305 [Magnetococcales bacterium]|nr:hypothetical protein [Magnetococcales bacterium]MBF0321979.1 hypothetical protein [Magnetococcales bacterium]
MNSDVGNLTHSLDMINKLQQEMTQSTGAGGGTFMGYSMTAIAASLFFSLIGLIFFRYGRNNGPTSTTIYGILLMVYPYFVTDTTYMIAIGIVLCILPFVLKFG